MPTTRRLPGGGRVREEEREVVDLDHPHLAGSGAAHPVGVGVGIDGDPTGVDEGRRPRQRLAHQGYGLVIGGPEADHPETFGGEHDRRHLATGTRRHRAEKVEGEIDGLVGAARCDREHGERSDDTLPHRDHQIGGEPVILR